MENTKIRIINLELVDFKNKTTGEVNTLTKITYGMELVSSDRFSGMSILTCYSSDKSYNSLKNVIYRELNATLEKRPTGNGVKYVISKINNESIR